MPDAGTQEARSRRKRFDRVASIAVAGGKTDPGADILFSIQEHATAESRELTADI
jgi:hypothetical protein